MSFPFYVNPEQMTQDKAEFARKGIARGKSIVTLEFEHGVLMVAENPLKLQKLGEIYDRIAFAGVGKFSEFDRLRKMGIQWADVEGYRFSREDVRAKALANLYSQALGEEFTRSIKPFEVEIVVAEVGDPQLVGHERNALYKVGFDGTIQDTEGYCVMGGSVENLQSHMAANYRSDLPLGDSLRLGRAALERAENGSPELPAESLEVCLLDRRLPRRKFRRLSHAEIREVLAS
jgi:proteasome alpha subunit